MEKLEKIINYSFKNKSLLKIALNHSSFAHKFNEQNNERLEFLGDSIIGFLVADFLIRNYDLKEGELTRLRAKIVSCENMSSVITKYGLESFINVFPLSLNKSEAIKGDFFEALVGAIYLDCGITKAQEFVFNFLGINKEHIDKFYNQNTDYKTQLQEYVQAKKGKIEYKVLSQKGKPNDITFEIELLINDKSVAISKEKSKQKAENLCAKIALEKVDNLFD